MKLTCDVKTLANKIGVAQKAINNKTTMDILKSILIETQENALSITGYNLELSIETKIDANIHESGCVAINAQLFGNIIKKLPDGIVNIEVDKDNSVYISMGETSKFKIHGEDGKNFPKPTINNSDNYFSLSAKDLKEMITSTIFAVSQDVTKPVICGELFEIKNGSISTVAIDGYRLAVKRTKISNVNIDEKLIIPSKTLQDISSLLGSNSEDVEIRFDNKNITFKLENTIVSSRLIDGNFIDYEKMIKDEFSTKVVVNKQDLYECIDRASILSIGEKNNLVKISIRDNYMFFSSNNNNGDSHEQTQIEMEGDCLDIAFNSRYLLEGIKNISSDKLILQFTSNVNPLTIYPFENKNFVYLILPVRISAN